MSNRNAMTTLTRWVLRPQEARRRPLDRPGDRRVRRDEARRRRAVDRRSTSPAARRSAPTAASPRSTAAAATSLRSCPSSRCPSGKTVDSPGVTRELQAALDKVTAAVPGSRVASYASTRDRAFVSSDGRTTFALVSIPAPGGIDPGQAEARAAQEAVAGVTVGRRARPRHRPQRAARSRRARWGGRRGEPRRRGAGRRCRCTARAGVRVRLLDGDRPPADGDRRHPHDVPADLAARERHRRLGHRQVPGRAHRPRHRDRLRAARRRPLA